jgi:mRNA-degrading endonuclease RelE of RelBE toxin-antitoxin system
MEILITNKFRKQADKIDNDSVIFAAIDHRSDIYKYIP